MWSGSVGRQLHWQWLEELAPRDVDKSALSLSFPTLQEPIRSTHRQERHRLREPVVKWGDHRGAPFDLLLPLSVVGLAYACVV